MKELNYYNRSYVIPNGEAALDLAMSGELQSATRFRRTAEDEPAPYNPFYLEPANDRLIGTVGSGQTDARFLSNDLDLRPGDEIYVSSSGNVLEFKPTTQDDLLAAEHNPGYVLPNRGYALGSIGLIESVRKVVDNTPESDGAHSYRQLTITRDLSDVAEIDIYKGLRVDCNSSVSEEIDVTLEYLRKNKAFAVIGTLALGYGTLAAMLGTSDLHPVTTPVLVYGGFKTMGLGYRPYDDFITKARDMRHASDAYEWHVDQDSLNSSLDNDQS